MLELLGFFSFTHLLLPSIKSDSKQGINQQEELRNSIISIVRQSAALNRPGAENMKPRQLLDAIYDEVG